MILLWIILIFALEVSLDVCAAHQLTQIVRINLTKLFTLTNKILRSQNENNLSASSASCSNYAIRSDRISSISCKTCCPCYQCWITHAKEIISRIPLYKSKTELNTIFAFFFIEWFFLLRIKGTMKTPTQWTILVILILRM